MKKLMLAIAPVVALGTASMFATFGSASAQTVGRTTSVKPGVFRNSAPVAVGAPVVTDDLMNTRNSVQSAETSAIKRALAGQSKPGLGLIAGGTTHAARLTAPCRSEHQRALSAFAVRFGELVEGETRLGQDGLPGLGSLMKRSARASWASWPTWRSRSPPAA